MIWQGPPTTKEDMKKSLLDLSLLATFLGHNQREDLNNIIGKLRLQIDHIPWKEAENARPDNIRPDCFRGGRIYPNEERRQAV